MHEFAQLMVQGLATGSVYALIALAFSIVFQTSNVLNFAQGGMLLLGTYLTSYGAASMGVPFPIALFGSCVIVALVGVGFHAVVMRRIAGQHDFIPIMVSLGFGIFIIAVIELVFGPDQRLLGDPWGSASFTPMGITILQVKAWSIALAVVAVLGIFLISKRSIYGLAIRALSADEEAAASVGVPVHRVHAVAWGLAGVLGSLAGALLAGYPNSPNLSLADAAFRAFPAVILGGLATAQGAVVGGVLIGILEALTAGYSPDWAGTNAHAVVPYIVMMLILLVRPDGLIGKGKVIRA